MEVGSFNYGGNGTLDVKTNSVQFRKKSEEYYYTENAFLDEEVPSTKSAAATALFGALDSVGYLARLNSAAYLCWDLMDNCQLPRSADDEHACIPSTLLGINRSWVHSAQS
jgi:hypothetical protein